MQNEENQEVVLENNSDVQPGAEIDLKAKLAEMEAEVKKLKAINQRHAEKELKKEAEVTSPKAPDNLQVKFADIEERVNLRLEGYEPAEVTEIADVARAKNITLSEAKKLPFVVKAIEGLRAEKKSTSESATPSNRVATFNGKPAKDVFVDPKATGADKQAAYEALLGKRRTNQSI